MRANLETGQGLRHASWIRTGPAERYGDLTIDAVYESGVWHAWVAREVDWLPAPGVRFKALVGGETFEDAMGMARALVGVARVGYDANGSPVEE